MKFNNNYEEEILFPYTGISLEESREIRYLINNMPVFSDGEVVEMRLRNMDKYIYANGSFWSSKCNKSFQSYIYKEKNGYKIDTIIEEILSHKKYNSFDEFIYENNDIEEISTIENGASSSKRISYFEEEFTRK